jgi:hypothetical protein
MLRFSCLRRAPAGAKAGVERKKNILVVGGSGFFGNLLCRSIITVFRSEPLALTITGLDDSALLESVHHLRNFAGVKKSTVTIVPTDLDLNQRSEQALEALLKQIDAAMVINLAGPFFAGEQGSGLAPHHERLIAACVKRGVHYVDIAESSAHITSVISRASAMLEEVKTSQSVIVTGASTMPALSTAFAADAIRLMMRPHVFTTPRSTEAPEDDGKNGQKNKGPFSVEVFLSPGGRVKEDRLGFAAIYSLLLRFGRTFPVIEGGTLVTKASWTNLRRCTFLPPVGSRLGCALESPDVAIFLLQQQQLLASEGGAIVTDYSFHAGLERPLITRAMALLGILSSRYRVVAAAMRHKYTSTVFWRAATVFRNFLGTPNGSFLVRVVRQDGTAGSCVSLVAREGHGIYLPIIPVLHVVETLVVKKNNSERRGGAFACSSNVVGAAAADNVYSPSVSDVVRYISLMNLAIAVFFSPSVLASAMGAEFGRLPWQLQAFHSMQSRRCGSRGDLEPVQLAGTFIAEPVWNPLLRFVGFFMGLPQGVPQPSPFAMRITATELEESWERRFSGKMFPMRSTLRVVPAVAGPEDEAGFHIAETFFGGFVKFFFRMRAVDARALPFADDHPVKLNRGISEAVLHFQFVSIEVAGLQLPQLLWPTIEAVEYYASEGNGAGSEEKQPGPKVMFDVKARAPFGLGLLCHYRGSVSVCPAPAA